MSTTIAEAKVKISADTASLRTEIEAEVRAAVAGTDAKVRVDADTGAADAHLAETRALADALDAKTVDVKVKTNTSDINDASDGLGGLLTTVVALGPALVPATAAVVGFGAASLGVLTAVGAGAGVVALGFKEVKTEVVAELGPALEHLRSLSASGLLPGVEKDIGLLQVRLPQVGRFVHSVATEIGSLAGEAGHALSGGGFAGFFHYVDAEAVPILDQLGHTVGNTAEGFAHLVVAFAPVTEEIGSGLDHLSARFASATQNSDGLRHFVDYVAHEGPVVVHTLEDVGGALIHVGVALAPIGDVVLHVVDGFANLVHAIPTPLLTEFAAAAAVVVVGMKAWALGNAAVKASMDALFVRVPAVAAAETELAAATETVTAATTSVIVGLGAEGEAIYATIAAETELAAASVTTGAAMDDLAASAAAADTALALNPVTAGLLAVGLVVGGLISLFHSSGDAAKAAGEKIAQSYQVPVNSVRSYGNALAEVASKQQALRQQRDSLDQQLSGATRETYVQLNLQLHDVNGRLDAQSHAYGVLDSAQRTISSSTAALSEEFGLNKHQVIQVANANNIDLSKSLDTVRVKFANAQAAARASHQPLSQVQLDIAGIHNQALSASQQLTDFNDLLDRTAGYALGAQAGALQFKSSLASLTSALQTSGGSFDSNTAAGLASAQALNQVAQQALSVASAVYQQTGSVSKSHAALRQEIDAIQQVAGHSQIARQEIHLLHKAYDDLGSSTDKAKKTGDGWGTSLDNLKRITGNVTTDVTNKVDAAGQKVVTAGHDLDAGYARGISENSNAPVAAAEAMVAKTIAAVQAKQQSQSPSKVMHKEGGNAKDGYVNGILSGIPEAHKAGTSIAAAAATGAASHLQASTSRLAQQTRSWVTQTSEYIKSTLGQALLGDPHQIDQGISRFAYQVLRGEQRGYLTDGSRNRIDRELDRSRDRFVNLSEASARLSKELGHATSELSNLKSAAASIRSAGYSSITGLGAPSNFNGVTTVAGLQQVLGNQAAVAGAFDQSLATLRKDKLNKAVYKQLVTDGTQDTNIAALLASMTPEQIAAFNKQESQLQRLGAHLGSQSADYLYAKEITKQTAAVERLRADQHELRQITHAMAHAIEDLLRQQIRGQHTGNSALIKAIHEVGPAVAKANHDTRRTHNLTQRGAVAGARI